MPTVPELLEKMAATYRERNAIYGDNYKNFGYVMDAMFPGGYEITPGDVDAWNRFGIFVMIVAKVTRLAESNLMHQDSAHDNGTYSAMLEELICIAKERGK